MQILTTISNFSSYTKSFTFSEAGFLFEFNYRKRTQSWYFSVEDSEGNLIASGRRLTPGWAPLQVYGQPPLPLGLFLVTGPENYAKTDFGDRLLILFIPQNEIPASQPLIETPSVIHAT